MIKKLTRNLLSTILTVLLAVGVFGIAAPKEVHAAGGGIKVTVSYGGVTYNIVTNASIGDDITFATLKSKITAGTMQNQKSIYSVDGSALTKKDYTTLKIASTGTGSIVFSEENPPKKSAISVSFQVTQEHTHIWNNNSYSASGNVITATCQGSGTCTLPTKPQLTLNASGKTYDGTAVTATATANSNWTTYIGSTPSITYSPANSKNAGTYTASVTVGNATATQSFTISPKQLTLTGVTAIDKTYDGTDVANLNTASADLSGRIGSDDVQIDEVTGVYTAGKTAGNGKAISATATLKGTDAGNYEISPISLTANISKKDIKLKEIYINDKVYDGYINATRSTSKLPDFDGLVKGDVVNYRANCNFVDRHVGNNKIVNVDPGELYGKDAKNYNLIESVATSTASITPADLYISGITVSEKEYDGNASANADIENASFTKKYPFDDVSIDPESVQALFDNKDVGNDKPVTVTLNLQGEHKDNYNPVITDVKGNITPKTITVSGITVNERPYDKTTDAPLNTVAATFDGIVTGDELTVSGTGTYTDGPDVGEDKPVSITGLTLGGADFGNYTISSDSQNSATGTVTQREVTVSGITSSDKTYDGKTDATLKYDKVAFDDKVGDDDLSVTATGTFENADAGENKKVTITKLTLTGGAASNYVLAEEGQQDTATAAITAKEVKVSGITVNTRQYDKTTNAPLNTGNATFDGIVQGETLTVSGTGTYTDGPDAKENKPVSITDLTLGGSTAGNYTVSGESQSSATGTVTKREITVKDIKSEGKPYDGKTDAPLYYDEAKLVGKVDGDGEYCDEILGVTAIGTFDDAKSGTNKVITLSNLTLTGTGLNNYVLASTGQQSDTTGDITKFKVTVTADAKTKEYGEKDPTFTFSSDPEKLVGDDILVGELSRHEGENVGNHMITVGNLHDNNLNYAITYNHAFLTITQAKTNNVTAAITGWTYGDTPDDPSATGKFGADTATFTYSKTADGEYSSTVPTDAGTWYVKATVAETDNYVGAVSAPVEFTIAPRPVKVSGIIAVDKTYDGNANATLKYDEVVFDNIVDKDKEALSVTATGTFVDANAGEDKTVNISGLELAGAAKDNYVLVEEGQQEDTTATITPRPVTVSKIAAENKTYDGTKEATLNYGNVEFANIVEGDEDKLTVTATGTFVDANAGEDKTVNISGLELAGAAKNNYVLAEEGQQAETTATIEPKEVELEWSDTELTYNGKAQKPSAKVTNLVGEDKCVVTVEGEETDSNVKSGKESYTAKAKELSNPNYKLPEEDEKKTTEFTISPKELTSDMLSVDPESIKNDGTKKGPNITLNDKEVGAPLTDKDYDLSGETESDKSGTHFFEVKGKGNYTGSLSSSWVMYENRQNHDKQEGEYGKGDIEIFVDVIGNTENITVDNFTIDFAKKLLSKDDLDRYNKGENVLIYVELKEESKDDVATKYKEPILSEFNKVAAKDIRWFDITVWKRIGNDKATQIHDTVDNLEMTISVPDEYKNAPADNTRTFYLARSHNGEADILTKTNEKKVGLSSNKFSIYALAYKDTYHGSKYIVPKTGD